MNDEKKIAKSVLDEVEIRGKKIVGVSGRVYSKMNKRINTIYGRSEENYGEKT